MINKSVLITGASTGIGKACAMHLDKIGFKVFAGYRKRKDCESLKKEGSSNLVPVQLDVTKIDSIKKTVDLIRETNDEKLFGLINNAGLSEIGPLEALPIENIARLFEINVLGIFSVTKEVIPLLRNCAGRIINIGSISGIIALPCLSSYAASKFAVEAITDSLRLELLTSGIKVLIIEPGNIDTPIWEKSIEKIRNIRNNINPELREFYDPILNVFENGILNPKGKPALSVAKAAAHALTAKRPKLHYRIGADALQFVLLKKLPLRLRDKILKKIIYSK